jgi:hypothetical protein
MIQAPNGTLLNLSTPLALSPALFLTTTPSPELAEGESSTDLIDFSEEKNEDPFKDLHILPVPFVPVTWSGKDIEDVTVAPTPRILGRCINIIEIYILVLLSTSHSK